MTICIDNSDTKNYNDKFRRNGYTALCQDHKFAYGAQSAISKLEIKKAIKEEWDNYSKLCSW